MGGALGGIGANVASITKGLNVSASMLQAIGQIAQLGDQRAAFNAVLLASAANAAKKPNFNLEVEINDLFVRLDNLRTTAPAASAPVTGQMQQVNVQLSSMMGSLDTAMKQLVQSIGGR